jgi:hypothetical protein
MLYVAVAVCCMPYAAHGMPHELLVRLDEWTDDCTK